MTNISAYRPYWHPIALISEITEQPKRFVLLDEKLVGFRTEFGISVFKDVCIHRGCALSIGRVIKNQLECSYHGWRYDHTGKCVRIPSLEPSHPIPSKARAVSYPVQELGGMVWVALEEPRAPLPVFPEGCEYGRPEFRSHLVNTYTWPVDAGRAVENFLDVSHFAFVHDGSLGDRNQTLVTPHDVTESDSIISYSYPQLQPSDPTTGGAQALMLHFTYRAPFSAHIKREVSQEKWSCVSLFALPISEASCRLFLTFVRNFDLDPEHDSIYSGFVDGAMKEDEAIVTNVHPEQIPVDLREELHIRTPDAAGVAFRRMLGRLEKSAVAG